MLFLVAYIWAAAVALSDPDKKFDRAFFVVGPYDTEALMSTIHVGVASLEAAIFSVVALSCYMVFALGVFLVVAARCAFLEVRGVVANVGRYENHVDQAVWRVVVVDAVAIDPRDDAGVSSFLVSSAMTWAVY